jgi:hypothetical protein
MHTNTTPVVTMGVTHGLLSYSLSNGVTPFFGPKTAEKGVILAHLRKILHKCRGT